MAGGSTADDVGSVAFRELVELCWGESRPLRHKPGKAVLMIIPHDLRLLKTDSCKYLPDTPGGAMGQRTAFLYLNAGLPLLFPNAAFVQYYKKTIDIT